MIKMIQITPSYLPSEVYGGATASVTQLCEMLYQNGIGINVLTTTANGTEELLVNTKEPVYLNHVETRYFKRITKDHTHFSPTLLWALVKLLKSKGSAAQIVHIHSWWNTVAIFSCLIAQWYRIPIVVSPRGMLTLYTFNNRNGWIKTLIHQLFGKRLLKGCYLHLTSKKELTDVNSLKIQSKNAFILPNLVQLAKVNCTITQPSSPKIFKLLFLSRIEEKKGLDLLFTALSLLRFQWKLTIAGNGKACYIQSLRALCQHLNLPQSHINWQGQVNGTDKFKLISENDVLVLPSQNENFANVIIESLSAGTPVVLSKEVGLAAYVAGNHLGWITELHSSHLARTLDTAAADEQMRLRIRKKAPQIINRDFCSIKIGLAYQDMYQSILTDAC